MNPVTFRNMTHSEKERYAYLSDLSCVETRGALIDKEEQISTAKLRLEDAYDALAAASSAKTGGKRSYIDKAVSEIERAQECLS